MHILRINYDRMNFEKFELSNGLKVIFNKDENTSIAAVNLIYNVGSKDEDPEKTGWAHLLEHLMFEGSVNIPDYDRILENAGGSNNAFTNNDYTNYYLTLPKNNLETALWLESDRMLQLAFNPEKFNTQKHVVIEEFKQTHLNEPYGDDMALLNDLTFKKHPYRWTTIGKDISHIEKANLPEIKDFYNSHYAPNNAVLSIGGNFELQYIKDVVNKWFGDIKPRNTKPRTYLFEDEQTERRFKKVYKDVPFDMLYMAFHYGSRTSDDYYLFDIITDILDDGKSSRFYQNLVKQNHIFDEVNAFITGNIDCGLVVFNGRPADDVSMQQAEDAIWNEINKLKTEKVAENELLKSINSLEFSLAYLQTNIMSKTRNLCYFELIGDVKMINLEQGKYNNITQEDIIKASNKFLTENKVSVLHYLSTESKR